MQFKNTSWVQVLSNSTRQTSAVSPRKAEAGGTLRPVPAEQKWQERCGGSELIFSATLAAHFIHLTVWPVFVSPLHLFSLKPSEGEDVRSPGECKRLGMSEELELLQHG